MKTRFLPFVALFGVSVLVWADDDPLAKCSEVSLPSEVWSHDWGGLRPWLQKRGIVPSLAYVGEEMGNTTGGVRRAASYEGLLTLALDVDLHTLIGWPGAKFHIMGYDPHGAGITQKAVGDASVASSIDAYDGVRLGSLWLQQCFFSERFSLQVGLLAVDDGDAFYQSAAEGVFIRSNPGWSSALGLNIPLPTYPYTAPGVRLNVQPSGWSYVMIGAYDGNPAPGLFSDPSPDAVQSTDFNKHGTSVALRRDEGAFFIGEVGFHFNDPPEAGAPPDAGDHGKKEVKKERGLFTSVKFGFAYDTDTFSEAYDEALIDLASPLAPARARARGGDWAVNVLLDQELYREPGTDGQSLTAFLHVTYMPGDRNPYDYSGEVGLVRTGLLPGRDEDVCAIGFMLIHASSATAAATRDTNRASGHNLAIPDFEGALEATYNARLRPGVWLQPDVQFIMHPGASREHGNALVIGLRTTINF